jgi:hypothetical protein
MLALDDANEDFAGTLGIARLDAKRPGSTAMHRIPNSAVSAVRTRVNPSTANFGLLV